MSREEHGNAWKRWEEERRQKRKKNRSINGAKYPDITGKDVISLDVAMQLWKDSVGAQTRLQEAEIQVQWKQVVGKTIAEHSRVVRLDRKKLIVQVEDAAWRHELYYLKREMIGKLNKSLGRNAIADIILTV